MTEHRTLCYPLQKSDGVLRTYPNKGYVGRSPHGHPRLYRHDQPPSSWAQSTASCGDRSMVCGPLFPSDIKSLRHLSETEYSNTRKRLELSHDRRQHPLSALFGDAHSRIQSSQATRNATATWGTEEARSGFKERDALDMLLLPSQIERQAKVHGRRHLEPPLPIDISGRQLTMSALLGHGYNQRSVFPVEDV